MEKKIAHKIEFNGVEFYYSKSRAIAEREIHDYHELLFYINGDATFRTENYSKKLKNYTLIFIPKGKYHLFSPSDTEKFTRLKISFSNEQIEKYLPETFFNQVKLADDFGETNLNLLLNAVSVIKADPLESHNEMFLYGTFLAVLTDFCKLNTAQPERKTSSIVSGCIDFIEDNLENDLSIDAMSKALNFSPSALSHSFKREMGISLHSFVTQKRLVYAKTLLNSGEKPTDVFSRCGYKDYSSFYKAYLKTFKKRPKD